MKKYCILLAMAISIYGCAGAQKKDDVPTYGKSQLKTAGDPRGPAAKREDLFTYGKSQARNLDTAKRLLQENRVAAATDVLVGICSAKGVPSVTDEAMFRLALLYLDGGQGKNDIVQAQQTLERLLKEYPASSWRSHAVSVLDLIVTLNKRIRNLRGENLSLTKENRELRLNIEKLKILDIEQELKAKR